MQQTSGPNLHGQRSEVNMDRCSSVPGVCVLNNKHSETQLTNIYKYKVNIKKGGFKNWIVI